MTLINLTALETMLGAPGPITEGEVEAEYVAGASGFTNVDGATVTFPTPVRVQIEDGELVEPLDLQATTDRACCHLIVRAGVYQLERWVRIPASGPIDFANLVDVDPAAFTPVDVTPTLVDTILEVLSGRVGEEVADYLTDHPVSSGVVWEQSIPLASWVIPHSLGRRPGVDVFIDGSHVVADVDATTTTVTVTFAIPTAGEAVLT